MRVVIQRVSEASVTIEGRINASIGQGLLILLGIENADGQQDIDWLCKKISQLRIFGGCGRENEFVSARRGWGDDRSQSIYAARQHEKGKPTFLYPSCQARRGDSFV